VNCRPTLHSRPATNEWHLRPCRLCLPRRIMMAHKDNGKHRYQAARRRSPTAIRALMQDGDPPVKKTSRIAAAARHGRRADQSRSLGMVLPCGRRQPLPDRRYLVADRDRRHSDHAASRRNPAEARLGDIAVLWHRAGNRRCRGQDAGGVQPRPLSSASRWQ
jgi:hypothetical protein